MKKLHLLSILAAGLTLTPVAVAAQSAGTGEVDVTTDRRNLRSFSLCVAAERGDWARSTLALPYLSREQVVAAHTVLSGRADCQSSEVMEFDFHASQLVGGLAEHFLRADLANADVARLAQLNDQSLAASGLAPRNEYEDLGLCVVQRDPAAARALVLTDPGSGAETSAATRVTANVAPCVYQGQSMRLDVPALRALVATALYRSLSSFASRGN